MSHVISAQPSATSPYQPTAMQEGNAANPPRIHRIDSEQHDDCCIHTRNRTGCCYFVCNIISLCCQAIHNCTESCCDCCANCLIDCCEDKPRERERRMYNKRYKNSRASYYDNTDDDIDWGITSLSAEHMHVGVGSNDIEVTQGFTNDSQDSGTHHSSKHHDSNHQSSNHNSETHHSSSHHDSGHQTSSHHDSGHHTSSHHDSGNHTSSHDNTCHSSGGGHDSGGGDTGGGDSGGGCDSGGGDSGGGGCDD